MDYSLAKNKLIKSKQWPSKIIYEKFEQYNKIFVSGATNIALNEDGKSNIYLNDLYKTNIIQNIYDFFLKKYTYFY